MLQIRDFNPLERQMLNIYQHTTGYNKFLRFKPLLVGYSSTWTSESTNRYTSLDFKAFSVLNLTINQIVE